MEHSREAMEFIKNLECKCQKLSNIIEGADLGTWEWNIKTLSKLVHPEDLSV